MIRPPQAIGFYPPDKSDLTDLLSSLFSRARSEGDFKWGVAPHAGYIYSGLAAASLYSSLKKSRKIIILGVDHYGIARDIALHPYEAWQTPLGEVSVSDDLREAVMRIGPQVVDSPREHSIEVQLPFLQHIWGEFEFLPVTVPPVPLSRLEELGRALADLGVPVVASSDFSHYVPQKVAEKLDSIAIDRILSRDPQGLVRAVYDYHLTMCGYNGVAALLYALPENARGKLIAYYTSGDVTGDTSQVVGYAAIGF